MQILDDSVAQPILVAAGGGGASDSLFEDGGAASQMNSADARGFLLEDLPMAQLVKMVPRGQGDAGEALIFENRATTERRTPIHTHIPFRQQRKVYCTVYSRGGGFKKKIVFGN